MTQNNLANALMQLPAATSEERARNVRQAIQCYQAALEIRTKDEYPVEFAMTQDNLGTALRQLPAAAPEERAITDGPFGSNLKSAHYTTTGARVFRLQNIGDGVFRDERAYISLDHFNRLRAHEAREGDLLIASLGDDPPRACLIPHTDEPAIVKADCIRLRLSPRVNPRWVLHTLMSPTTKQATASLKTVQTSG